MRCILYRGEGGIRTHGGLLTLGGFQDRCHHPLGHLAKTRYVSYTLPIELQTCSLVWRDSNPASFSLQEKIKKNKLLCVSVRTRAVFRIRTGDTCLEGRNVTTTLIRLVERFVCKPPTYQALSFSNMSYHTLMDVCQRLKFRDHEPVLSPCELARQNGGPYKTYYCCTDLYRATSRTRTYEGFPQQFCRLLPLPLGFMAAKIA